MKEMIVILLSAILTQNFVLSKTLGICPFLGVSKKLDSAVGMSVAVTFVMVLATAVTWPIQIHLLDKYELGYMQTIVFILVIAALVQLVEMALKKFLPPLYESLGIYLPSSPPTVRYWVLRFLILMNSTPSGSLWSMHWAPVSASCWPWCCLPGYAAVWKIWISPSRSRVCPSRSSLPSLFPCPLWALAVW